MLRLDLRHDGLNQSGGLHEMLHPGLNLLLLLLLLHDGLSELWLDELRRRLSERGDTEVDACRLLLLLGHAPNGGLKGRRRLID